MAGAPPRTCWGRLQHSPRPTSWIWGERRWKETGRGGRKMGGEKREGEGQTPQAKILATAMLVENKPSRD